jgi:hypothetical protein
MSQFVTSAHLDFDLQHRLHSIWKLDGSPPMAGMTRPVGMMEELFGDFTTHHSRPSLQLRRGLKQTAVLVKGVAISLACEIIGSDAGFAARG